MDLYCDADDARAELLRRQSDPVLAQRVRRFVGTLPDLPLRPFTAFARHLPTARYEDADYVRLALSMGFDYEEVWWFSYLKDKFVTANHSKVKLAVLPTADYANPGKKGGIRKRKHAVVHDIPHWDGRPIYEVRVKSGETLSAFHCQLRQHLLLPKVAQNTHDLSAYLQRFGSAEAYYPYFLALFVAHGVLVEEFEGPPSPELKLFKHRVVLPAVQRVIDAVGIAPLIVRMPWEERHGYYPPLEAYLPISVVAR